MCNCHSILECCVMFSGVKLTIRSFNFFIFFFFRTVHEQGGCLVLSSCFNVLYFTKVNLILPDRVVGLLFMSYVTE